MTDSIMRFEFSIVLHDLIAFDHFKLFSRNLFICVCLLGLKYNILNVILNRLILLTMEPITCHIKLIITIIIHKDIMINVFFLIFKMVLILH